ncbi:MAG: 23S rRNA (uracil(1939)-C(5))-methyltransferase RlmD [Clostridia bacterium]|nr:23S rRNA (uracil(1939)-C(5))-methyltransferase RlmD [Clostridia bacterium]
MKKNEIYEIEIIDIGNNGEGIGKVDDFVVFIPYTLKGEIIKTLILKVNKNFAYGKILNIVKQSEFRVEPPCPYFYKCGGCNLQHLQYAKQLVVKKNIVETTLKKQLGEVEVKDCVASNLQYAYRNKMQLPATINGIGMFRENSHDIVEIENCLLCDNWIQTFIKNIKLFIQATNLTLYDEENHKGVLRHILARKVDNNYSFTLVINAEKLPKEDKLIEILSNDFESFSLFYCVNKIKNNTILTNNIVCLYGNATQNTVDFEIEYFISPNSFLQVNRYIQNCIYQKIQSLLNSNQIVIDAYSGAGLLSAILSKKAKQVYGIEIVKSATENAEALMKHNKIANVKNINGDCALILPTLVEDLSKSEDNISLVLDPPRKGCDEKVLEAITLAKPNEIFYISCNPSTLARDLKKLTTSYDIEFIEPYDMFPQTKHIETLVRLKLKK